MSRRSTNTTWGWNTTSSRRTSRNRRTKKRSTFGPSNEGPFSTPHSLQNGQSEDEWNSVFFDILENWKRTNNVRGINGKNIPQDVQHLLKQFIDNRYGLLHNSCMNCSVKWCISDKHQLGTEIFINDSQMRLKSEKFECAKLQWQLKLLTKKEYNYVKDFEDSYIVFRLELLTFPSSIDSIVISSEFKCLESNACYRNIDMLTSKSANIDSGTNILIEWPSKTQNINELRALYYNRPRESLLVEQQKQKQSAISPTTVTAVFKRNLSLDETDDDDTKQSNNVVVNNNNNNNNQNILADTSSVPLPPPMPPIVRRANVTNDSFQTPAHVSFEFDDTANQSFIANSAFGAPLGTSSIVLSHTNQDTSIGWGDDRTFDFQVSQDTKNYYKKLDKINQITFVCNLKILKIGNRFHCEFESPFVNKNLQALQQNINKLKSKKLKLTNTNSNSTELKENEIEEQEQEIKTKNLERIEWKINKTQLNQFVFADSGKIFCSQLSDSKMWYLTCIPSDPEYLDYVRLGLSLDILPVNIAKIKVHFKLICIETDSYFENTCVYSYGIAENISHFWSDETLHLKQLKSFDEITFKCMIQIVGITDSSHVYQRLVSEEDPWLSYIQREQKQSRTQIETRTKKELKLKSKNNKPITKQLSRASSATCSEEDKYRITELQEKENELQSVSRFRTIDNHQIICIIINNWTEFKFGMNRNRSGKYGLSSMNELFFNLDDKIIRNVQLLISQYVGHQLGIDSNSSMTNHIKFIIYNLDDFSCDNDHNPNNFLSKPKVIHSPSFECASLKFRLNVYPSGNDFYDPKSVNFSLELIEYPTIVPIIVATSHLVCEQTSTSRQYMNCFRETATEFGWRGYVLNQEDVQELILQNHNQLVFECKIKVLRIYSFQNCFILYDHLPDLNVEKLRTNNRVQIKWNIGKSMLRKFKLASCNQHFTNYDFLDNSMFCLTCVPKNLVKFANQYQSSFWLRKHLNVNSLNSLNLNLNSKKLTQTIANYRLLNNKNEDVATNFLFCISLCYLPFNVQAMRLRCKMQCLQTKTELQNLLVFSYKLNECGYSWADNLITSQDIQQFDTLDLQIDIEIIDVIVGKYNIAYNISQRQHEWLKSVAAKPDQIVDHECKNRLKTENEFDLKKWLDCTVGLPEYYERFNMHAIDTIEILSCLNDNNLKQDLGIQIFGHRIKILLEIEKLLNSKDSDLVLID